MATFSVVLVRGNTVSDWGDVLPVAKSQPVAAESITTSGASAAGTAFVSGASPRKWSDIWVVTASGGNVWVKFGASPTAAAGDDWLVVDGTTREFGVSVDGENVAVINA